MDPFLAEVRIFAGTFAPRGWALCNGQILPIQQNTALFSLLGVTYGGNGTSNFALPNFQGSAPLHPGQGSGLSQYFLGQTGGTTSVTLLTAQMAAHSHAFNGDTATANLTNASGNMLGSTGSRTLKLFGAVSNPPAQMNAGAVGIGGGGLPHANQQPFQVVTYIIALQGIYPQRQ